MPGKASKLSQHIEARRRRRSKSLSNPMVQIKFPGNPIYQLKVRDISDKGVGVLVRPDSKVLTLIEVGQEMSVKLMLPRNYSEPSGSFRAKVEHITEIEDGRFKGHMIVGLSFPTGVNPG